MHILNSLSLQAGSRGAADTTTEGDAHAGHLALERAEHQLAILRQIEAGPVQIGQLVKQEGGKLRGIGDEVALAAKQCLQLRTQQRVTIEITTSL